MGNGLINMDKKLDKMLAGKMRKAGGGGSGGKKPQEEPPAPKENTRGSAPAGEEHKSAISMRKKPQAQNAQPEKPQAGSVQTEVPQEAPAIRKTAQGMPALEAGRLRKGKRTRRDPEERLKEKYPTAFIITRTVYRDMPKSRFESEAKKEESLTEASSAAAARGTGILSGGTLSLKSAKTGEVFPIDRAVFRIGKKRELSDLAIDNRMVSRRHAEIVKRDGAFYIRDRNSTNGTVVENVRLAPDEERRIAAGDHILFADEEYIVTEG